MELVTAHRGGARICVVGEGMVEFVREGECWRPGTGGDALNIAVHLARFGHDVAFATALGTDRFSGQVRARLAAEGIDGLFVLTDRDRQAGLYFVETDAAGERSFTYWRSDSAARRMFALPDSDRLVAGAGDSDMLVFSLITLAILPPEARATLLDCARAVRSRGGSVVFDGNYRPRLWANPAEARVARDAALAVCDIGLPTIEDEAMLGLSDAATIARHWVDQGAGEVIVKLGAEGCRLPGGTVVPPPVALTPVDTSDAGDASDCWSWRKSSSCGPAAPPACRRRRRSKQWSSGAPTAPGTTARSPASCVPAWSSAGRRGPTVRR